MPRSESRAPAPDGQKREVELGHEAVHRVEEPGVTGEVDALRAHDCVAQRRPPRAERRPPAGVLSVMGSHKKRSSRRFVSLAELDDALEAPQQSAGTAGNDGERGGRDEPERRQIEMVVMRMRNEHGIDSRQGFWSRHDPPQVADAGAEKWVCDQSNTVELEQNGGVADIGDPHECATVSLPLG